MDVDVEENIVDVSKIDFFVMKIAIQYKYCLYNSNHGMLFVVLLLFLI